MMRGANPSSDPAPDVALPRRTWRQFLVDREVDSRFLRVLLHLAIPIAASLLLHGVAVVLLGLRQFELGAPQPAPLGEYEAGLVESLGELDAGQFDWSTRDTLSELAQAPLDQALAEPQPIDAESESLGEIANADLEIDAGDTPGRDDAGLGLGDGALSILGAGSGGLAGAGSGGLGGTGLGGGGIAGAAGMWGLRFTAKKVVYVVDFSGSVTLVVDHIRRELKRSITALQPDQTFNVIVFFTTGGGNDEQIRTEAFEPATLVPATPENRRAFGNWIDRWSPGGYTRPVEAVRRALEFDPEVVIFHSDGNFEDAEAEQINTLNRLRRTRIYALVFDELLLGDNSGLPPQANDGVRRMRRIAEASGGQVRIVTAGDLNRTRQ